LSAQIKVLLEYEYAGRGLLLPGDGDTAIDWAVTELGEVHELLLAPHGRLGLQQPGRPRGLGSGSVFQ
jgi:hypothetical protein